MVVIVGSVAARKRSRRRSAQDMNLEAVLVRSKGRPVCSHDEGHRQREERRKADHVGERGEQHAARQRRIDAEA